MTAPRSCAAFSLPYAVQEGNRKGPEFFEEVVFYAKDTGEVYHVEGGRLLTDMTFEGGKPVPRPPRPALIVVLVTQRSEHLVYATGQADVSGKTQPDEDTTEYLQEQLRGMMEGLQIARPLPVS